MVRQSVPGNESQGKQFFYIVKSNLHYTRCIAL